MPEARAFRRAGRGKSAPPVRRGESGSRLGRRPLSYSTGSERSRTRQQAVSRAARLCRQLFSLWHKHDGSLPERGFLPTGIEDCHLAVILAGLKFVEGKAESKRRGFQLVIHGLRDRERRRLECLHLASIEGHERDQGLGGGGPPPIGLQKDEHIAAPAEDPRYAGTQFHP